LSSYSQNKGNEGEESDFRFLILGIKWDREALYKRINERCKAMFKAGLPDEVRRLYESGSTPLDPGMRAIGYREFFVGSPPSYTLSRDLAGVEALVAQNCRRYAKRQIVFFSSIPNVTWIEGKDLQKAAEEVRRNLLEFL
jgi:tRNA dimethylallyltransferase